MQLCCDEKRLILGISVSLSEQEKQWRAFLQSLVDRGVKGAELIISDAHVGSQAARKAIFTAFQGAMLTGPSTFTLFHPLSLLSLNHLNSLYPLGSLLLLLDLCFAFV
jgi:hypothetical protein